jgi:hypothetical protein
MPLPIPARKTKVGKNYQEFCKPPHKNNIAKPSSLSPAAKDKPTKKPREYYISPGNTCQVLPGCIVWLPAKEHILSDAFVDGQLHANAFNHPAIILSVPSPLKHDSVVEFAIVSPSLYPFPFY